MDDLITDTIHVRVHTTKSRQECLSLFQQTFKKFIISYECGHIHVLLVTPHKEWIDKSRDTKLHSWVKESFSVKGNGEYSIKLARNKKQLKKYVLKEGDYEYKGFTEEELKNYQKASNKKGLDKISKEIQENEMMYFQGKITIEEFYERYVDIKVSYGQNIYWNHMDAYVQKIKFKNNKKLIAYAVNERLHGTYSKIL